jgi:flagellar basal body-associated protein FliL
MKKKSKYLILIPTLVVLVAIALLSYFFLIKNNNLVPYSTPNYKPAKTTPATSTPPDLSIMTKEERVKLKVIPSLNVEVLRRDKDGFPAVYRIIK